MAYAAGFDLKQNVFVSRFGRIDLLQCKRGFEFMQNRRFHLGIQG